MARFRILHISDLHVGNLAGRISLWKALRRLRLRTLLLGRPALFSSHDPFCLAVFGSFAIANKDDVSGVLITGDLSRTGHQGDLLAAKSFLNTLLQTGKPVWILPGNHDRIDGRLFLSPHIGSSFESHFASHWRPNEKVRRLDVLEDEADATRMALIAVDVSLADMADAETLPRFGKFFSRYGQGYAYQDIIDALESETRQVRAEYGNLVIIWACHFPPEIDNDHTDVPKQLKRAPAHLRLRYGNRLLAAAHKQGVLAILCGHLHRHFSYRTSNGIRIAIAGTLSEHRASRGNWAHLIELEVDPPNHPRTALIYDVGWDGTTWGASRINSRIL